MSTLKTGYYIKNKITGGFLCDEKLKFLYFSSHKEALKLINKSNLSQEYEVVYASKIYKGNQSLITR